MIYIQKHLRDIYEACKGKNLEVKLVQAPPKKLGDKEIYVSSKENYTYHNIGGETLHILEDMFDSKTWARIIQNYMNNKYNFKREKKELYSYLLKNGLTLEDEILEPNFNDVFWNGSHCASVSTKEGITLEIKAYGDVIVDILKGDEEIASSKDKSNSAAFRDNMQTHIPFGDQQIIELNNIENEKSPYEFSVINNNWFEVFAHYEPKDHHTEEEKRKLEGVSEILNSEISFDAVMDSGELFGAIKETVDFYEEIVKPIIEEEI